MMSPARKRRGSRLHRFMIVCFSALLTLLFIWLLGFVLHDLGNLKTPDYREVEKQYVDQALIDRMKALQEENKDVQRRIENQKQIQGILRESTSNSRETMNTLLAIRRLSLENEETPSESETQALAESESLYLENQKKFQDANEEVARLSQSQRDLDARIGTIAKQIEEKKKPAREEYQRLRQRSQLKQAAYKLSFLLPLTLLAAWLVKKKRKSAYAPIAHAAFVAAFVWVAIVVHEHFPSKYFKYIAIAVAIAIVLGLLIKLIRNAVAPKADWLLKQYRDAYNHRQCPICSHPIQRGPLRHIPWPIPKKAWPRIQLQQENAADEDKPYACPSCGQQLYEKCERCDAIRHSLLPYCEACGNEKPMGESPAPTETAPAT